MSKINPIAIWATVLSVSTLTMGWFGLIIAILFYFWFGVLEQKVFPREGDFEKKNISTISVRGNDYEVETFSEPTDLVGVDERTGEKHIVGKVKGKFVLSSKNNSKPHKQPLTGKQSSYPQTADEYAEILNERMTSLFNYCLERKNCNITDSEMKEYFDDLQMHCAYGPPDYHESVMEIYKNDTWFHADDFKVPGQYQVIISRRTNRKEIHINFASFGPPESDDLTGLMITTTAIDGNRENKLNFYCSAKRFNEDDKLGTFSEAVRDKLINDYEGYSGGNF